MSRLDRAAIVLLAALAATAPPAARAASADGDAVPPGVAPQREFDRIAEAYNRDAPSAELVDRLYDFMEKYPRDPRSDTVQFWVALTQQKRKFHNEAIKEFDYLLGDFPASPLVTQALRRQIDSYLATGKPDKAAENYAKILARKFEPQDAASAAAFRDAVLFMAERHAAKKEIDAAVALYLKLPDRNDAITRVVHLYLQFDRHDDALRMIRRLPASEKLLAYRLTLTAYAQRPGTANLYALMEEIMTREPVDATSDALIQQIASAIGSRGTNEKDKVLRHIAEKRQSLRRWAEFALCELHRADLQRLLTFIGDWRSGADVERVKRMVGELHEIRGDAEKARAAYWLLEDKPAAHFLVAATYYGKLAGKKDLAAGRRELTEIVKRFYSPAVSAEALFERAELEAGLMGDANTAIGTLRELIDRFPRQAEWSIKAAFRLGALLRSQKKQDEAIAVYDRLMRDHSLSQSVVRRALLEVAACHEEKSDAQRAIATYRSVIRKYPRTYEASRAHTVLEQRYGVPDVDVSDK